MSGWEPWVAGLVVLFVFIFIGYLDWHVKHPEKHADKGIPVFFRVMCLLCGLFIAGLSAISLFFYGSVSVFFIILSVFLIAVFFFGGKIKSGPGLRSEPAPTQTQITPPSVIQGLNGIDTDASLWKLFRKLLSKAVFRIPFMLFCFFLFLWGAFQLAIHPAIMEKYSWLILLGIAVLYISLRVLSIRRLINSSKKTRGDNNSHQV